MKTKEMLREERGITLVALIITIIVLIILAAVSINAVLKTDFIGLATNGTINYAEAQVTEQKQMDDLNDKLDNVISKIEEVSIPTYTGYSLSVDEDSGKLGIRFSAWEIAKFLKDKVYKMTDEEIFVKSLGYDVTFEQYIEEAYNEGKIKEKYSTVKEAVMKQNGVTESEAEKMILEAFVQYLATISNKLELITPTGESLESNVQLTDTYYVPMEVKDYTFQIIHGENSYPIKVKIKPYELVESEDTAGMAYALDVENKRFLTINSAKVNIDGKEINLENQYLEDEAEHNYLKIDEVLAAYQEGSLTRGGPASFKAVWASLSCNEGVAEGYVFLVR